MVPKNKKSKIVVSAFALSALTAITLSGGAHATGIEDFPDEVFRDCVLYSYYNENTPVTYADEDTMFDNYVTLGVDDEEPEDGEEEWLTPEQLASIKNLHCSWDSTNRLYQYYGVINGGSALKVVRGGASSSSYPIIHDLTGIEQLTHLKGIYLGGNAVTTVDLSDNTDLEEIDLSNNNITSIILPQTGKLRAISLADNKIRSIDLSGVPNLLALDMANNLLTSIDLSHNPYLQYLILDENNLEELDLSHNPYLYAVSVLDNAFLPYADFSTNSLLGFFRTLEVPFYLGNKAFEDEDGAVKVRLDNIEFTGEASQPSDDDPITHETPGFGGGDIITGLPDVDGPVSPEMTFIDVLETDEYHVEVDDNGVRTVVFDDFNDETSNIVNLVAEDGIYRLVVNFGAVRGEQEEEIPQDDDVPAVPNTGTMTNDEEGQSFGVVASTVAAVAVLAGVVAALFNKVRNYNRVKKF